MLDRKIYDKIIREFKGKGGGTEAESILVDTLKTTLIVSKLSKSAWSHIKNRNET